MFNIGTLIQVSALTMGVASATPIRNANETNIPTIKNENIVNNYELTLEYSTQQNTHGLANYTDIDETQYTVSDAESVINYRAQSNYLNVLASKYETRTFLNDTDLQCFQNNQNTYYANMISRITWALEITPYNFNIDTELHTNFIIRLTSDFINNDEYRVEQKYLNKNVYTTSDEDWSNIIRRQLTWFTAFEIINDITNPNNNFYYSQTTTKREIQNNTILQPTTEDTTELTLTPNKTNYILIDYVISFDQLIMVNNEIPDNYTNKLMVFAIPNSLQMTVPTISGTNVIPDGTYEVIDLPGLMWQILTMPFAFVSQAFNLTLFAGTPYQVNVSNLFLSIIAVLVFVWLITFFIKLKG